MNNAFKGERAKRSQPSETGYFNDENSSVEKHFMESALPELEERLRQHGYDGASLGRSSKFYPSYAQVAWAYHSEKVNTEDAERLTDDWVEQNRREL